MKKTNILQRILSIMLVFVMLLSGISLDFSDNNTNVIDVDAGGEGGGTGGSGGGAFAGGGSGTINGVGWRFTLTTDGIIADNTGTVSSDLGAYICNNIANSIVVTSYTGNVACYPSRGSTAYTQMTVSSINQIFPSLDASGFTADIRDGGVLKLYLCNEFFKDNGTFVNYIGEDKGRAIDEFCSARGISISDDYSNICFVVEPVLIYDNVAMSYQDCLGAQDGSAWSYGFSQSIACSTSSPNNYLSQSGNGATKNFLKALRTATVSFTDTLGVFGTAGMRYSTAEGSNYSGFYVYGAGTSVGKAGKTSASYTLFYEGNATQSNKSMTVYKSMNGVIKDYYSTIHYNNTSDSLPSNIGDAKLATWGTSLRNPFNKDAIGVSRVTKYITGLTSTSTKWSDYSLITAGVQTIQYADVNSASTSNIVTAVTSTVSDIQNMKLVSSSTSVTGGNFNVGSKYTLKIQEDSGTISTNKIVSAVANKLANKSTLFTNSSASSVVTAKQYQGSVANIATNFGLDALDSASPLKTFTRGKIATETDSTMGVSVTLMAKKKSVTSYVAYATLDRDSGNITYGDNSKITYDVSDSGTFTVPDTYSRLCLYIAFPNSGSYSLKDNRNGSTVFTKCGTDIADESGLRDAAVSAGVTNIASFGFITKGQTINVGCDANGNGYSVLVLQLTGNVTRKSTLELYDYELNYIYPSMLTNGKYASLSDTISYKKTGQKTKGSGCNRVTEHITTGSDDKTIEASSSYAGNIINKNLTLGSNKNILRYDSYTGGIFTTEKNAREGYTFTDNLTNVKFSLAVNLIRSSFGDNVVVSSISGQTITDDYLTNNLGLVKGNKPSTNVANASAKRNSNATVGTDLTDTFEWNIKYTLTDTVYQQSLVTKVKDSCSCFDNSCAPVTYHRIVETEIPGSSDGTRVKYVITEKAYKYQTDTLETAKNDTKTVSGSLQVSTSGKNNTNSVILNPYRIAVVNSSDKTLGFYPEVRMRAYESTGDTITNSLNADGTTNRTASGAVTPRTVLTMGEVKRTLKPSSMYAIKVTAPNNNAVTGTTLSDSIAVGSNASNVSGGLPVIYAGGNVSLNVTANFKLNMYAYSLDLIETTDTNLTGTGNYSSVVADNSAVKSDWGNDSSYKPLDDFNTWISDTLSKLAVDTTLTVKGDGVDKTYNNFASSIGNLGDTTASADGVFNIRVQKGTIVDDGGYQALLNQIKADYGLNSTDEAKELFKNSDIYQSIARAVEDCNDSFNTSRKSNAIDSSRDHWYDEEVKTFVIRRYKKEDIEIKNILVDDKIDYGAAPTADKTTNSNNSYKKATAKWYLTLYFKELPTGFSTATLYDPSSYAGLSSANTAGTVLVNEVYINGADFVVPSASTYDMGN